MPGEDSCTITCLNHTYVQVTGAYSISGRDLRALFAMLRKNADGSMWPASRSALACCQIHCHLLFFTNVLSVLLETVANKQSWALANAANQAEMQSGKQAPTE